MAVTGVGIITALGIGWEPNAAGFRTGQTAFRPVSLFDVSRQRVKVAAEVDLPAELPATRLGPRQVKRMERAGKMVFLAAHQAIAQSGWSPGPIPMVLGTTSGGMSLGQEYLKTAVTPGMSRRQQPSRVLFYQAQRQGLIISEAFGLEGPVTVIANACAAGANAVGHAWELIRTGRADRVLCGGYDALSQLVFSGFDALQALSTTACKPFDKYRDGLALGEGAAVLALERFDLAQARGATLLGEVAGYGAATDAHHLTQPHPHGDAALASMTGACEAAGIHPSQVGYINAHGTGTPLNDSAEAAAINRWAEPTAARPAVSSTKAGIGHLLGAAGAVEAVICLMALREGWLPPSLATQVPDDSVQFPLVTAPNQQQVEYALSNSFGFGGANASLIFRKVA